MSYWESLGPLTLDFVARFYFHQRPQLLQWALTKPMDRVLYNPLAPLQRNFDLIQGLMIETGVLDRRLDFGDYVDERFALQASKMMPWAFEPGQL